MSQKYYYAVFKGNTPGIYHTWDETKEQVHRFRGAIYQRFSTEEEARSFMNSFQEENKEMETNDIKKTIDPFDSSIQLLSTLTTEQLFAVKELVMGKNIALLGAAGCGKTYLLSILYQVFPSLQKKYKEFYYPDKAHKLSRIQICALTGCAALLLGHKAKTLHSWAGIGLGKGTVSELFTKIRRNTKSMRHWLCTDLLIIDEVSMMTAELLDKLNELAKKIRNNKQPFGGMQLMVVGDFYQLPPVNKTEEATKFAFESHAWKEVISTTIELTQIQRQKDPVFQTILREARMGQLSPESSKILQSCQDRDWKQHKIRPTLIFPRRAEVDMINDSNLRALPGRRYRYKARLLYDGKIPDGFTEKDEAFQQTLQLYDVNAPYLPHLELALNAQVMLTANIQPEQGLVNGSRGVIVEFCPQTELPIVEFVNGLKKMIGHHHWPIEDYEFISRSQIPLRLGYGITTHRSQGSTLDAALIDIGSGIFEYGQAYVALSRVKSLDALYLYDFDPNAFRVHPKVVEFYKQVSLQEKEEIHLPTFLSSFIQDEKETNKPMDEELEKPKEEIRSIVPSASQCIQAIHVQKLEAIEPNQTEIETTSQLNWLYESLPPTWKPILSSCEEKLLELSECLSQKEYLPSRDAIWKALECTALEDIKVVILGQDPYPTKGHSMGLAFSVLPDVRPIPASLKNIYKELTTDVGFVAPMHGNLEEWAKQGVFLLNTVLTVEEGSPQSHTKIGWEEVTDQILRSIAAQTKETIFVLWGKSAQVKKKLLNMYLQQNKHRIFESAHPSPLSAHRGFLGSRPFSTINSWRKEMGKKEINWQL